MCIRDRGIPEKEVRSQVAKAIGGGVSLYQKLPTTKMGEYLGGKAADVVDFFSKWSRDNKRDELKRERRK